MKNVLDDDSNDEIILKKMIMMTMMTSMTSKRIAESLNFLLLQKEKEVLVLTLREIVTFNHDETNSKTCILQLQHSGVASESLVLILLKLTTPS